MDGRAWRGKGFRVLFSRGSSVVIVLMPHAGIRRGWDARWLPKDGGSWMDREDFGEMPRTELTPEEVRRCWTCYCGTLPGTPCDYCTGKRVPPIAVRACAVVRPFTSLEVGQHSMAGRMAREIQCMWNRLQSLRPATGGAWHALDPGWDWAAWNADERTYSVTLVSELAR